MTEHHMVLGGQVHGYKPPTAASGNAQASLDSVAINAVRPKQRKSKEGSLTNFA